MVNIKQLTKSDLTLYEKRLLSESYKEDGTPIEKFVKDLEI